jgi:hypothetical protein
MSNVSIFKNGGAVTVGGKRELSDLARSLASSSTSRRISTKNSVFRRIINGEEVGKITGREFNAIIVNALPKVSRKFYAEKYDPKKDATLPDCWSNLGDKPEAAAKNKQAANCMTCPQNVKGSGDNGGRACRFERRIAILLEGDSSGDIYQFNIPGASLFGKGTGNVHPFESYIKYLVANGESPDTVVTQIAFDTNAESMELLFTPVRNLTDEEYELVQGAQSNPDSKLYVTITAAQADKVTKQPEVIAHAEEAPAPKVTRSAEPDDEVVEEPVKRQAKTTAAPAPKKNLADVVSAWSQDE